MQKSLLIVTSTFPVYSETFIVDHIKGMLDRGWVVSVAANKIDRRLFDSFFSDQSDRLSLYDFSPISLQKPIVILRAILHGVRHAEVGSKYDLIDAHMMAIKSYMLSELISNLKPDLVHAHFGPNGVLAAMALKNKKIPLIVNFHGYDVTSYVKEHGWELYRKFFNNAILVAHSKFVIDKVANGLGRVCEHVVMGADLEKFTLAQKHSDVWPNPLRFLSVGRLTPSKGHDVAIDVIKMLRARYPDKSFELSVIGGGEEHARLIRKIVSEQLSAFVRCLGVLDAFRISLLMRDADVLLVCSQRLSNGWEEAFCRVAVEGMACGLAVVVTPCGGLPDTVDGAGYVAKGFDAASVLAAFEELISADSPSVVAQRGSKKSAQYDANQMIDSYSAISTKAMLQL